MLGPRAWKDHHPCSHVVEALLEPESLGQRVAYVAGDRSVSVIAVALLLEQRLGKEGGKERGREEGGRKGGKEGGREGGRREEGREGKREGRREGSREGIEREREVNDRPCTGTCKSYMYLHVYTCTLCK